MALISGNLGDDFLSITDPSFEKVRLTYFGVRNVSIRNLIEIPYEDV